MSKAARSIEELFPLIEYCRAGKLAEVSEWIEAGNPLDPPPAKLSGDTQTVPPRDT